MSSLNESQATHRPDDIAFHSLRVVSVRRETNDATSLVIDVPEELRERFAYRAGQFVTIRLKIDGKLLVRSYSMSTAPEVDTQLRITVKRVAEGRVSRWLHETLEPGLVMEVMSPAGRFCLRESDDPLVLLGAGSGITPLLSLAKSALASTARKVTLIYANRDRSSIIFADELDGLAKAHRDRFRLIHWLKGERGYMDNEAFVALAVCEPDADYYICGPSRFMHVAHDVVKQLGVIPERIFTERFASPPDDASGHGLEAHSELAVEYCETVTIKVGVKKRQLDYRAGDTILDTARRAGMQPPFSCTQGTCGQCMASITAGTASMRRNYALTAKEVDSGLVLTCQAVPTSRHVTAEFEGS